MTAYPLQTQGRARVRDIRIQETLEQHQPHPNRARTCACWFPIRDGDSQIAHQARMVATLVYGLADRDLPLVDRETHRPGPENIAMHRALKEPLCPGCQAFLRSLG